MKQNDTFEQHLRVKLTKDQIVEKAKLAGDASRKLADLEDEAKQIRETMKGKIEQAKNEGCSLLDACRLGYEVKPVTCERRYHSPIKGQKQVVRLDTMEAVEGPMQMTSSELQEELEFDDNKPKKGAQ
jgi:hypothetical protein